VYIINISVAWANDSISGPDLVLGPDIIISGPHIIMCGPETKNRERARGETLITVSAGKDSKNSNEEDFANYLMKLDSRN